MEYGGWGHENIVYNSRWDEYPLLELSSPLPLDSGRQKGVVRSDRPY